MKTLQEHLTEQLNGRTYCEYFPNHVILYNLDKADLDVKEKFDEIGMGFTSKDDTFNEVGIEMHYDTKEIFLTTPMFGMPGIDYYGFKVKDDLVKYHDKREGLTINDLKIPANLKKDFKNGIDRKIAEFLCWFFNNTPEPLFKTAPKGTTYHS